MQGHQHTQYFQLWIRPRFHLLDRFQQVIRSFEREIGRLNRNQHVTGRDQRVYSYQAERRRRVDHDHFILLLQRLHSIFQTEWRVKIAHQFRFKFRQTDSRRHELQILHRRFVNRKLVSSLPVHHQLVSRASDAHRIQKRDRAVGLGIEIEKKRLCAAASKRGCEIDGGGGLADAAFLVSNRDYQFGSANC